MSQFLVFSALTLSVYGCGFVPEPCQKHLDWAADVGLPNSVFTYPEFTAVTGVSPQDATSKDVALYWTCYSEFNVHDDCRDLEKPCDRICHATPDCSGGILSGNFCCHKDCSQCTGTGCSNSIHGSAWGGDNCCGGNIARSGKVCTEHQAPCLVIGTSNSIAGRPIPGLVANTPQLPTLPTNSTSSPTNPPQEPPATTILFTTTDMELPANASIGFRTAIQLRFACSKASLLEDEDETLDQIFTKTANLMLATYGCHDLNISSQVTTFPDLSTVTTTITLYDCDESDIGSADVLKQAFVEYLTSSYPAMAQYIVEEDMIEDIEMSTTTLDDETVTKSDALMICLFAIIGVAFICIVILLVFFKGRYHQIRKTDPSYPTGDLRTVDEESGEEVSVTRPCMET